ncbi:hypothetical protein [Pistricoccus aurantiacus]|uniref:hypothetical protein n=1 Tax=Pistricoccus aurantiacus TaxID=1883414 RepID=UPI003632292A
MSIELEVRDGDPWWLSPDIWTVPGDNPEGSSGTPIVGQPCYLWCRVRNNGSSSVNNATVRFYWANPATGFDRNSANLVGTANVNLAGGGGAADVLCLTPWVPEFINDGHECVLAEAFHPSLDPLPSTPDFDVPTDRHVAQRNLTVVQALRGLFHFTFEIHNAQRDERTFHMEIRQGELRQLEPLAKRMKIKMPCSQGKLGPIAFVDERCPGEEKLDEAKQKQEILELSIAGHRRCSKTLIGRIEGDAMLLHIVQRHGDRVVGGVSLLVLNE